MIPIQMSLYNRRVPVQMYVYTIYTDIYISLYIHCWLDDFIW